MKRFFKKFIRVISRVIIVIIAILMIWCVISQVLNKIEKKDLVQSGKYVTVKEKKMNVYSCGQGDSTILLMTGLGTTSPVLDFEPLINSLSKNFHVVVVEPFGYGWSDLTNEERSAENIIEEIRSALHESGEMGPYVLMPHSVSGIYSTWYIEHYPEEVSAMIGIDCTLPRQVEYFDEAYPSFPQILKVLSPLGISRFLNMISPTTFTSEDKYGVYSKENLEKQKLLSNTMALNETMVNEANHIKENMEATKAIEFKKSLPLLFFTLKIDSQPGEKTSKTFYESYITNPNIQSVIELDARHYMHWTKSEEMSQITNDFLMEVLN